MNERVEDIFTKALSAYSPAAAIKKAVTVTDENIQVYDESWSVDSDKPFFIIGVGKAAPLMVETLSTLLHAYSPQKICIAPTFKDDIIPEYGILGSHPLPDEKSEKAARQLLDFIQQIPPDAVVFFALSGGASALLCKPAATITLAEMAQTQELLLNCGATIDEINIVRKHISQIKGGQLLSYFDPNCTLIDLVISDVPGDDLAIIGSGLTTPDSSTFQEAYKLLQKHALWEQLPQTVCQHIKKGMAGKVPETIKPDKEPLKDHHSVIISSAQKLAHSVANQAQEFGYQPWVAKEAYDKPVEKVAELIIESIQELRQQPEFSNQPSAFIFFGESTVEVAGSGKGGRNQQLALHAAEAISGWEGISWLSAGTDGIDGPTDAAGAIVDGNTWEAAREKGIEPTKYIENNDSYHFHQQMGSLLMTGPTGNNLMDLVLITCSKA